MPDLHTDAHLARERDIHRRLIELSGPEPHVDDFALFSDILQAFLAESPRLLAGLTDAIDSEQLSDVEQKAHVLKGAAANVGATALATLLQTVEDDARTDLDAGRGQDFAAIQSELAAFNSAAEMVADDLERHPSPTTRTYPILPSFWSYA